jgi:hypothetical protein
MGGEEDYGPVEKIGAWEITPRWLFWKPERRRQITLMCKCGGCPPRWEKYEYQHPAFVAREALEKRYG